MKPANSLVRAFLILCSSLLTFIANASAQDQPNVLFVVVDDLRFDDFGAVGIRSRELQTSTAWPVKALSSRTCSR